MVAIGVSFIQLFRCPLIHVFLVKPTDGEPLTIIPLFSGWSVRVFDGGWSRTPHNRHISFDFVNDAGVPVNTPIDWAIWSVPGRRDIVPSVQCFSVEAHFKVRHADIPTGEERFHVFAGHSFRIDRPGHPSAHFQVPASAGESVPEAYMAPAPLGKKANKRWFHGLAQIAS